MISCLGQKFCHFMKINNAGLAAGPPGGVVLKTQTSGQRTCFWNKTYDGKAWWNVFLCHKTTLTIWARWVIVTVVPLGGIESPAQMAPSWAVFSWDAKGWLGVKDGRRTELKRSLPSCWHCKTLSSCETFSEPEKVKFWDHQLQSNFLAKKQEPETWPKKSAHLNFYYQPVVVLLSLPLVLYRDLAHLCNILKRTHRSPNVGKSTLPQVFILLLPYVPISATSPFSSQTVMTLHSGC